jgi:hypothetical protein
LFVFADELAEPNVLKLPIEIANYLLDRFIGPDLLGIWTITGSFHVRGTDTDRGVFGPSETADLDECPDAAWIFLTVTVVPVVVFLCDGVLTGIGFSITGLLDMVGVNRVLTPCVRPRRLDYRTTRAAFSVDRRQGELPVNEVGVTTNHYQANPVRYKRRVDDFDFSEDSSRLAEPGNG